MSWPFGAQASNGLELADFGPLHRNTVNHSQRGTKPAARSTSCFVKQTQTVTTIYKTWGSGCLPDLCLRLSIREAGRLPDPVLGVKRCFHGAPFRGWRRPA